MSKYLFKTILSPALITLMLFFAMFTASAETGDQFDKAIKAVSDNKKISTSDENGTSPVQENIIPTMKPAHYYPINSQEDNQPLDNKSDNINIPDNASSDNVKFGATPEMGAQSQLSTPDILCSTPDISTLDEIASKGIVNTSDTSVSVFVLFGLIALSCLLIAVHKKEIVD